MAKKQTRKRLEGNKAAKDEKRLTAVGPVSPPPRTPNEIGRSGTLIFGGIITDEEYNADLIGRKRFDVYEQMRKGDATVKASLNALVLPLLSANMRYDAASDDQKDQDIADWLYGQTFDAAGDNPDFVWEQFFREALTYLPMGFWVGEIVLQPTEDGKIGLCKIAGRKQKTIYKWEIEGGKPGVTQITPNAGELQMPLAKLLVLTNEKEGDNYEGVSILRSAYKHWYILDNLVKIDAMAHERQALGIPKLSSPTGASGKNLDRAKELLRNLRANEEGFLEEPAGYTIEFMDMQAHTTRDIQPSLGYHRRQILLNVLAEFLDLGAERSGGAYALSQDQSRLHIMALEHILSYVKRQWNQTVVKLLVDLNWPGYGVYPELASDKLGDENIEQLTSGLQRVAQSGFLTANFDTEQSLRQTLGLPPLDEGLKDAYEPPEKAAAPITVNTSGAGEAGVAKPTGDAPTDTADSGSYDNVKASARTKEINEAEAWYAKLDAILES